MKDGSIRWPFKPESLDQLRKRLPAAIETPQVCTGPEESWPVPSQMREHIFDFYSGLRLIVSRDHFEDEEPPLRGIHFSASLVIQSGPLFTRLMSTALRSGRDASDKRFQQEALVAWQALTEGVFKKPILVHVSEEKCVPHWMIFDESEVTE